MPVLLTKENIRVGLRILNVAHHELGEKIVRTEGKAWMFWDKQTAVYFGDNDFSFWALSRPHICLPGLSRCKGMKEAYGVAGLIPTSTNADIFLIRSHIAYWAGVTEAEWCEIKPSRGHSYKIDGKVVVRITDHYDHREGVAGYRSCQ